MVLSDEEIRVISEAAAADRMRAFRRSFVGMLSYDTDTNDRMYNQEFNRTQQRLMRERQRQFDAEGRREFLRGVAEVYRGVEAEVVDRIDAPFRFLENIPSGIAEQVNIRARRPTGSLAQMAARAQEGISNTLRNRRIAPLVIPPEENPPVATLLDDRYDAPTEREDAPTERESNED